MKNAYQDIRERLGEPAWFDLYGVPRYCAFAPAQCGVYRRYIAFAEVACQDCGQRFKVAVERDAPWADAPLQFPSDGDPGSFHYGDPPIHRCIGNTMNSVPVRIIEFWRKDGKGHQWERDALYETEFPE